MLVVLFWKIEVLCTATERHRHFVMSIRRGVYVAVLFSQPVCLVVLVDRNVVRGGFVGAMAGIRHERHPFLARLVLDGLRLCVDASCDRGSRCARRLHFVWEVQVGRGPTPFTNDNVRGSGCDLLVIKDANVNELIAMFASYLPALAGFVHKAVAFECLFSSHFFQVVSFFVRFGFPFGGCGLSFLGNGGGGGGGGGGGAAVVVTAGGVIVWKI